MKRYFLVPVFGALALAIAVPASAQFGRPDDRYGYSREADRVPYDRGYKEGVKEGEKDGRSRDPFRYQDEKDFQRADIGYNRNYGSRARYQDVFRQGFVDGYAQGYRRYAPAYGNGRYGNDGRVGYPRGNGGYGSPNGRYGYPQSNGGYGYPQDREDRYLSPFDIGARDGYDKGREDGRDNRHDPRRHKWYREGDHDYNDRYGSRDRFKDEYRRGFLVGYERGFQDWR